MRKENKGIYIDMKNLTEEEQESRVVLFAVIVVFILAD